MLLTPSLALALAPASLPLEGTHTPEAAASVDLEGAALAVGDLDVSSPDGCSGVVRVARLEAGALAWAPESYGATGWCPGTALAGADVDGDSEDEIVAEALRSSDYSEGALLFGAWDGEVLQVDARAVGDLDGDGFEDLARPSGILAELAGRGTPSPTQTALAVMAL